MQVVVEVVHSQQEHQEVVQEIHRQEVLVEQVEVFQMLLELQVKALVRFIIFLVEAEVVLIQHLLQEQLLEDLVVEEIVVVVKVRLEVQPQLILEVEVELQNMIMHLHQMQQLVVQV